MNLLNLLTLLTIDKFEIILLLPSSFPLVKTSEKSFPASGMLPMMIVSEKTFREMISFLQVGVTLFYVVMEFLWGLIVDN